MSWQDYRAWREAGVADSVMAAVADDFGVQVCELEFLHGWASDAADIRRSAVAAEEVVWAMADNFGARHVNVGDLGEGPPPISFDVLVDRFAGLCDRAARRGLLVGYEWLPGTLLPDLEAVIRLVEEAGRGNAGLVVDVVHLVRRYGRDAISVVRSLPPSLVVAIQLADADISQVGIYASRPGEVVPTGINPARLSRRLPGEGGFDLVSILRAFDEIAVEAPVGLEVISPEIRSMPVMIAARVAYDAAVSVFTQVVSVRHDQSHNQS